MIPITEREENIMYGVEVPEHEYKAEYDRFWEAYDADDFCNAAFHLADKLKEAMDKGLTSEVGRLLYQSRVATSKRRAEFVCYGKITTPEYL